MNPLSAFSQITPDFLPWCLSAATIALALDTVLRLVRAKERLLSDAIEDEDRALAWKCVLFILLPFLTWIDMRATEVVASYFGAYLDKPVYGLVWYEGQLKGLSAVSDINSLLIIVFAGVLAQLALAMCLVPTLLFRPHPFVATLIGYGITFTFALNLIFEPLLAFTGMGTSLGSPRLSLTTRLAFQDGYILPLVVQISAALLFVAIIKSSLVKTCFAALTRPKVTRQLTLCIKDWKQKENQNPQTCLKLGLLYIKAGLLGKARTMLKVLDKANNQSDESTMLRALYKFHRRKYKESRLAFEKLAESKANDYDLKSQFFAAASCAAFAEHNVTAALNLADQALEFENSCLVARMVKVDAYLAQGKKEQAAQEIMQAMRLGLNFDLKDKIPLDIDLAYKRLTDSVLTVSPAKEESEAEALSRS